MTTHELITKYPIPLIFAALFIAFIIKLYGILFLLLFISFFYLLFHVFRLYRELFSKKNPKAKLNKMLSGKMLFDNNVWMDKSYELLFDNIKYLCKKGSYKVILFQIQIDEIANIRNRATDESSDEYKMAALAIKRIEDFQKSKALKVEDKIKKEEIKSAPEAIEEEDEETQLHESKEFIVKIEQNKPAPKKPELPKDPKEGVHKSLLIDSLITRITDTKIYTFISVNQELRVRLRAFLTDNPDKKIDIVEAKAAVKSAQYVDRWRSKLIESFEKKKSVKQTKAIFKDAKKLGKSAKEKLQAARNFKK